MPTRLTVLGSGTLLPDDDRRSAAHLVEVERAALLLDCGAGTVHGFDRHGIDWRRITHVAISHYHTDHVGDLPALIWALRHGCRPPRGTPLTILGPPGLGRFLESLAEAHGEYVLEPGFPVEVVELRRSADWDDPKGRFRLVCHPTSHTDRSVCYRVETTDGALGYTGDTGPDRSVTSFLSNLAVLVSECSLPDPPEIDTHLTPRSVAEMARSARPDLLLLTHLYPFLVPSEVPALVRAAGYAGKVLVAGDGTTATVEDGTARTVEEGRT